MKVKDGETGKTFKAENISFYMKDVHGVERYVGMIGLLGSCECGKAYTYIPSGYRVLKESKTDIRVVKK